MKNHFTLLLLSAVFALAACGGQTDEPAAQASVQDIQVTDPDQVIEVEAGEEFTITLETNPNTGLHWEVAVELDTAVVDYVWKEFIAKSNKPDSPGWDVWTFKGVAPGQAVITLGYYRGFSEIASRTLEFTVIVK